MNIIVFKEDEAISQDEFKGLKIVPQPIVKQIPEEILPDGHILFGERAEVVGFRYSVELHYGVGKENTVRLYTNDHYPSCVLWYHLYLYLFSISKDIGLIKLKHKDLYWFNNVIKEYQRVLGNIKVVKECSEVTSSSIYYSEDVLDPEGYSCISDNLTAHELIVTEKAYDILRNKLQDDYIDLIKDYVDKVIVNGELEF